MKLYIQLWPDMFGPAVLDFVKPFSNQSLLHWGFCVVVCALVSILTPRPKAEQVTDELTINWKKLNIFGQLGQKWYQSVILWWGMFVGIIILLMIIFSGNRIG